MSDLQFRQVINFKQILTVIQGVDPKALGNDIGYFVSEFGRQAGLNLSSPSKARTWDVNHKDYDRNITPGLGNEIKMWLVISHDMKLQESQPPCLITRADPDGTVTVCIFDAGDTGKTAETMQILGKWCRKYKAVRFHSSDDRIMLLARYAGYNVKAIETIYLATPKD